ncbi:TetR/AcrR family transcriptional regulator [Desulfosarcina sp.]|uniref:TetR/AcrR family transcriptional regulator n=1 Tax=Desulfosarcina sp. TaxID=2027861 RepID=UPI003970C14A
MHPADRKTWEQEQRKRRIVEMAEAVFFENGYDGTTLPAIADAAGYNKRTLYLYFQDKQDIFLAVVLRGLESLYTALKQARDKAPTNSSGLRELAFAFFEFSSDHPQYLDLMMVYESRYFVYPERPAPADSGTHLQRCQQVAVDMALVVTASIEAGMARGRVRRDLSPRQLMLILCGQIVGVIKIMRMREKNFEGAFAIGRKALFDRFVGMVELALEP